MSYECSKSVLCIFWSVPEVSKLKTLRKNRTLQIWASNTCLESVGVGEVSDTCMWAPMKCPCYLDWDERFPDCNYPFNFNKSSGGATLGPKEARGPTQFFFFSPDLHFPLKFGFMNYSLFIRFCMSFHFQSFISKITTIPLHRRNEMSNAIINHHLPFETL